MAGKKGRSGRRAKPSHIHLVDGSFRADRHGSKDAARRRLKDSRTAKVPRPPSWLPQVAKNEWRRVVPLLRARGNLDLLDRASLSAYCLAWSTLKMATDSLERDGLTITGGHGGRVRNPAASIANQAARQVRDFAVEFGLTPAARPRLEKAQDDNDDESLDRFLAECEVIRDGATADDKIGFQKSASQVSRTDNDPRRGASPAKSERPPKPGENRNAKSKRKPPTN